VDDFAGTIELQFFDGTVDEADPERWLSMQPKVTEPPEDWSGSVDVNNEDLPYIQQPLHQDWQYQLDQQEIVDFPEETD